MTHFDKSGFIFCATARGSLDEQTRRRAIGYSEQSTECRSKLLPLGFELSNDPTTAQEPGVVKKLEKVD